MNDRGRWRSSSGTSTWKSLSEVPLDPLCLEALKALRRLWPDRRCVLVGAMALDVWLSLRWRKTEDLDLALELTPEELSDGMAKLSGWSRQSELTHSRSMSPETSCPRCLSSHAASLRITMTRSQPSTSWI